MDFPTAQPKPPTALCGVVSSDGKITYPPGVKEITDKITNDEVVKRLKGLSQGRLWLKTCKLSVLLDGCDPGLI